MRATTLRAHSLLLLLVAVSLFVSGCARVKPWERDALARRDMAWSPDPMQSTLQNHIRFSKEGSLPAGGGGGGAAAATSRLAPCRPFAT